MERTREPGLLLRMFLLIGLCLVFVGCASKPEKNFVYAPTANAADELRNLQAEMDRAEKEQISVFAPESYAQANKHWEKARKAQESGKSNSAVLEELGPARAFFEQAKSVASNSMKELPDVADARENALIAGAALHNRSELKKADDRLMDITEDFEDKDRNVSLNQKTDLMQTYLDLELKGIKATRLGDAQSKIEGAKKMGAKRYAPNTLALAEEKLKKAEIQVNTDRHNDALLTAVSAEAVQAANRLVKVTEISKGTGKMGNENYAIDIVNRDEKIAALNAQMMSAEAARKAQQQQLEQQRLAAESQYQNQLNQAQQSAAEARQLASSASSKLESQRRIDEMYRQAQNEFTKQEADVYRQGDNLIIRLKSIRFPTGRADVPAASYQTLNKVKDVIKNLNAGRVTIEGHTDATGKADINQEISQQRADSVASFLQADLNRRSGSTTQGEASGAGSSAASAEPMPQIEAVGYGFEHPISSNKTKAGRAQNRRVDIVIAPEVVNQ